MRKALLIPALLATAAAANAEGLPGVSDGPGPNLVIEVADAAGQSKGTITLDLYADKAPNHVARLVELAKAGAYDGVVFHRVIDGFMIQGGGFTADMQQKPTKAPIPLEAANGLKNDKYTIAMARTANPNSATSQFFINHRDNDFLDHGSRDFGYAVFAKVVRGMDVVDQIAQVPTGNRATMQNVPLTPVKIITAKKL